MSALEVNGWKLYAHPLLIDQLGKLAAAVALECAKHPKTWKNVANAKLLAALRQLLFETVPQDPTRAEYRQGKTLGEGRKHWFRVKFGNGRFRLFFRYSSTQKTIIFAWVNDQETLRTYGAKTDAYAVFRKCSRKETHQTRGKHSSRLWTRAAGLSKWQPKRPQIKVDEALNLLTANLAPTMSPLRGRPTHTMASVKPCPLAIRLSILTSHSSPP